VHPIPTLYEVLLKMGIHFSFIFRGTPTCSHVVKTAQGLKGKVLKKKFVLPIEPWFFTFFTFFFFHGST
jgi:hypothetical protein